MGLMPGRSSSRDNPQEKLFRELWDYAEQCGIKVRCEKLTRDFGYRVRSGACMVRGKKWVIVDRSLSARDRVDLLADEIMQSLDEKSEIPAGLRPFLGGTPGGTTS